MVKRTKRLGFVFLVSVAIGGVFWPVGAAKGTPQEGYAIGGRQLIPAGWSKKGNFAYFLFYDEGDLCGYCPVYDFIIQSLVTDQVWVQKQFDALDHAGDSFISFDRLTHVHREFIQEQMTKYEIIQTKNIVMGSGDFSFQGFKYSVNLYPEYMTYSDEFMGNTITKEVMSALQMELVQKKGKKALEKIVYRYRQPANDYLHLTEATYAGYFLSPYEERAALVLQTHQWGCCVEGTSQSEGVVVIGAHLKKGFRSKPAGR